MLYKTVPSVSLCYETVPGVYVMRQCPVSLCYETVPGISLCYETVPGVYVMRQCPVSLL